MAVSPDSTWSRRGRTNAATGAAYQGCFESVRSSIPSGRDVTIGTVEINHPLLPLTGATTRRLTARRPRRPPSAIVSLCPPAGTLMLAGPRHSGGGAGTAWYCVSTRVFGAPRTSLDAV